MGKTFSSAFAICLLVSALPLACGDDEEGGGGGGKGKGGSSGSGTGGSAGGGATGGTAGGGATGGSGGAAGRGGTGGAAGSSGAGSGGMTGGTAGTDGGMGGMDSGGEGGVPDTGGVGGEGGGGAPPAPLCERYCDAGAVANCTNPRAACITTCEYNIAYGGTPECVTLMEALYECHLAATPPNWTCSLNQPTYGGTTCMAQATAANDGYCLN